jgi:DNA-directed RNA polymerase subunit RPC12/RpoP
MKRNVALGAVAVVAIAAAAFLFTRSSQSAAIAKTFSFSGVCLACQKEGDFSEPLQTYPPYACPHCKKQAVYPWYYCYECKKKFVPDLIRPPQGGPLVIPASTNCPCPNCRSGNVGAYSSLMADGDTGTAPLPKWEP